MKCPNCDTETYTAMGGQDVCPNCGFGASSHTAAEADEPDSKGPIHAQLHLGRDAQWQAMRRAPSLYFQSGQASPRQDMPMDTSMHCCSCGHRVDNRILLCPYCGQHTTVLNYGQQPPDVCLLCHAPILTPEDDASSYENRDLDHSPNRAFPVHRDCLEAFRADPSHRDRQQFFCTGCCSSVKYAHMKRSPTTSAMTCPQCGKRFDVHECDFCFGKILSSHAVQIEIDPPSLKSDAYSVFFHRSCYAAIVKYDHRIRSGWRLDGIHLVIGLVPRVVWTIGAIVGDVLRGRSR